MAGVPGGRMGPPLELRPRCALLHHGFGPGVRPNTSMLRDDALNTASPLERLVIICRISASLRRLVRLGGEGSPLSQLTEDAIEEIA